MERVLGRGGMGEVLLAHDTLLRRRVALKHLRGAAGTDAGEQRAALLQEARRASQVSDRRIAAIHDVLDLGDELLIVMEYVEGETLRQSLRERVPIELFWDLSLQCVEALGAAHEQGVIHRDIKPENLMLTRGHEIKILDFGLAWRARAGSGTSTESSTITELHGATAGTPLYMAPEAHYGGRIDARTDLYSLGVVFYELLTAHHPFAAESQQRTLERMMHDTPRPASESNPAVSPALAGVLDRMLARDPAQRFASCADVREALLEARRESGEVSAAAETIPMARVPRAGARRSWVWAVAGVGVVLAGVVTWKVVTAPRLPPDLRLAVLPPATPGASEDFAAYALGETELLANRLLHHQDHPGFQMATFSESYEEKLTSAADARKALGMNVVLRPTIEQRENRLFARLELHEPPSERLLGSRTVDVSVESPFAFADSLYHAAVSLLRIPARPQTAQEDLGIRGAGTLRFLLQGIGRRRASETVEAKQRALADFETAYRTEPDPAAPRAWLASAQIGLFNATKDTAWLARAEAAAREAVSLDSNRAESHRTLAAALAAKKRHTEALEQYRIAAELDPADDEAWHLWGRSWLRLGKPEEERKVYEAAVARRPHWYKARWWLASWEFQNGHIPEAIAGFREMIRRAPTYFKGYGNLGGLLLFRGDYRAAIDTIRLAVELRPNAGAFNNLGTAYFNAGQLTQAVDAYNQAFQFDDADYVLWMNLGDAYFFLRNRPDQARDAYRQAVRLGREQMAAREQRGSSADAMIPAHLAAALPKLGEPDSARAMLRQALALDSLNSRVQYQAALTEWQLGAHDAALVWLRRAIAGGYPVVWLRDSPVHRDWRDEPGFRALLTNVSSASEQRSPDKGGSR